MKRVLLGMLFSVALIGCSGKDESAGKAEGGKQAADPAAGKAFVERECKGCHGLDGRSTAPGIPHLAGQTEHYLIAAIDSYRQGKRYHAALKQLANRMSDADSRNVAAYFAGLSPFSTNPAKDVKLVSPYEEGKQLAAGCVKCHAEDGNSKGPGIPSLAGQQPRYLVDAMREYLHAERKLSPMHPMLRSLSGLEMESLALYFASQTPAEHKAPPGVNPAAGEPLSAVCGGCHGVNGVSVDSATPSLASQDYRYLVDAIKAYRTTRKREKMRVYVSGLSDKEITEIAAFYAVQKSRPAEKGKTIIQDLTDKCVRCHAADMDVPGMAIPKINGQDRDYLVRALRAYRDGRRESSLMHKMSLPYSDSIIESLSSYYAMHPEPKAPAAK